MVAHRLDSRQNTVHAPYSHPCWDFGSKQPWQFPKETTGEQYLWSQHQIMVPQILWTPAKWVSKALGKVQEGARVGEENEMEAQKTGWNKKYSKVKDHL